MNDAFGKRIAAQLARLSKFFHVTNRFADYPIAYENASCPHSERMKTMIRCVCVSLDASTKREATSHALAARRRSHARFKCVYVGGRECAWVGAGV